MRNLHKHAKAAGYRLWKVRETSKWYSEFGPYSLIDANTNCIVGKALEVDAVRAWLTD